MPTINTWVQPHPPFTYTPGFWANHWFRVNNGQWQSGLTVDKDTTTFYPLARPWAPNSWDIDTNEPTVMLEEDMSVSPPRYRHAYVLFVQNVGIKNRSFFLVGTEFKP
jgi:hypothetical protein